MTRSQPHTPIVLVTLLTWIALVVLDHAQASGTWAATIRDGVLLLALTTGLAAGAAAFDDWLEDLVHRR